MSSAQVKGRRFDGRLKRRPLDFVIYTVSALVAVGGVIAALSLF